MKWKIQVSERTVKFAMMANVPPGLVEGNTKSMMKRKYASKQAARIQADWINMWGAYQQGKMGKPLAGCAAKPVKVKGD
jgi:hypothetical protein